MEVPGSLALVGDENHSSPKGRAEAFIAGAGRRWSQRSFDPIHHGSKSFVVPGALVGRLRGVIAQTEADLWTTYHGDGLCAHVPENAVNRSHSLGHIRRYCGHEGPPRMSMEKICD